MAELLIEGNELVVRLESMEKIEAVHGDLRFPMASVKDAEVIEDALETVHGIRSPGMRVPGYVAVGTFHYHGKKTFAVVHHETHRGVRISLDGQDYDDLIIGANDPESVVTSIGRTDALGV